MRTIAVAALALLAAISTAQARRAVADTPVTQFCDTRYCGTFQEARPSPEAHHGSKHRRQAERRHGPTRAEAREPAQTPVLGAGGAIVAEARRYIGTNPTGWSHVWCARFMNMVLERAGYRGTGSDVAADFARWGHRLPGPVVGAIAVMGRRGGGHVGVVTAVSASTVTIVSGNTWDSDRRHRVMEAPYSRGRVYAYVAP